MSKKETNYVVDTSSFIDLKHNYPEDIFKGLWLNIENLIEKGNLISPSEVREELSYIDDGVSKWARKQKNLFKKITSAQANKLRDILSDFPGIVDQSKEKPDADPFVIALALVTREAVIKKRKKVIVVSEEKEGENKIPSVCREYKIEAMRLHDFFRNEDWNF